MGEEALDRASGRQPAAAADAQCALARARLAAGDVTGALREAEEAFGIGAEPSLYRAGQPHWALGAVLTAAGNAERAVPLLREALPDVIPVLRADAAGDLVDALLAAGDVTAARDLAAAPRARAATPRRWPGGGGRQRWPGARSPPRARGRACVCSEGRALAAAGDRPARSPSPPPSPRSTASAPSAGATRRCASSAASGTASGASPARRSAPHRPRARDRRPRRRGPHEPRGRGAARAEPEDDRGAPAQHLRQARRPLASNWRGRPARSPASAPHDFDQSMS